MTNDHSLTLFGFHLSVYTRVVRIVLSEKAISYSYREINPFADDGTSSPTENPHPLARVPTLLHGKFQLYETAAISRYVDTIFPRPALVPQDTEAAARITQVIGIVDAYAYWPMVRQVFAHGVLRPHEGLDSDPAQVNEGLGCAEKVLDALETISAEGHVLNQSNFTLADCHLAPMIAAFATHDGARSLLRQRPALSEWWHWCFDRSSLRATDCGFDRPPSTNA